MPGTLTRSPSRSPRRSPARIARRCCRGPARPAKSRRVNRARPVCQFAQLVKARAGATLCIHNLTDVESSSVRLGRCLANFRCRSRLGLFELRYQPLNVGGSVDQLNPNLTGANADEVERRGLNGNPMRATRHHVMGLVCVVVLAVLVACRRSDTPAPVNTPESTRISAKASAEL